MEPRDRRGTSAKNAGILFAAILAVVGLAAEEDARTVQYILKEVNGRLEREFISAEGLVLDYMGDIPDARDIAENRPNAMGW